MKYYYPGCKYKAHNPEVMDKLYKILEDDNIVILGCCSKDFDKTTPEDEIIYQCPTCGLILSESAKYKKLTSLYECFDQRDDIELPKYESEEYTIQDCWRTRENKEYTLAIRNLLNKMHINYQEIEQRLDKTDYCGATLYQEPSKRYEYLAPKSLVEKGIFNPLPIEKQNELMVENAKRYKTDKVICYCTGCLKGIELGGKKGIHILDLILNPL